MSGSQFLDEAVPLPAPAGAVWAWGTVTQTSPLRVRIDGDRHPQAITPADLGGAITRPVGQRVYCQVLNRQLIVFGGTA